MRNGRAEKRLQYIRDTFAPEDKILKTVSANVPGDLALMKIGAEEGRMLQFFVQMIDARKIVEIGTLTGYSAIWMARGMTSGGHLWTIDRSEAQVAMARDNLAASDVADNVTIIEGEALDVLADVSDHGPFDLVFIDADKYQYAQYLDWAETHARKGGLIIGDNTFLFGAVYDETLPENVREIARDAMQAFNRRLGDSSRYNSILLPTEQGMTVAQKLF